MISNIKFEDEKKVKEVKPKGIAERIAESFINRRQVYLWGAVTDKSAETIVERLIFLENQDPGKPIYFFINSPGGVITSGMAIYDIMAMISSPIYTITMGMAASMGAILFCAGEKGYRYVFKHAKVMIHQPLISGQIIAPAVDIKIHATEIKKTRNELNRILADATGKKISQIEDDTDRDYYLNAEESVKYGIADAMLAKLDDLPGYIDYSKNSKANKDNKDTETKKKTAAKKTTKKSTKK